MHHNLLHETPFKESQQPFWTKSTHIQDNCYILGLFDIHIPYTHPMWFLGERMITDHFTRYAMAIPTSSLEQQQKHSSTSLLCIIVYLLEFILIRVPILKVRSFKMCVLLQVWTNQWRPAIKLCVMVCVGCLTVLCWIVLVLFNLLRKPIERHEYPLAHVCNCTNQESTEQTPYLLMFGRNPRLRVDMTFWLREKWEGTNNKSVCSWLAA